MQNPVDRVSMSTLYCFSQVDSHTNYHNLYQLLYIRMSYGVYHFIPLGQSLHPMSFRRLMHQKIYNINF